MRPMAVCLDILAWLAIVATLILVGGPHTEILPWIKAAPAFLWSLSFLVAKRPGWILMAIALLAASAGDWLLASGIGTVAGVAAFAVMQALYSVRFWSLALVHPRPRRGIVASPLIFASLAGVLCIICLPKLGALAVPLILYCLLLVAMASGSVAARQGRGLGWGGTLFFVSDALILVFMAYPVGFNTEWAILVPYYIGQALIVHAVRDSQVSREH